MPRLLLRRRWLTAIFFFVLACTVLYLGSGRFQSDGIARAPPARRTWNCTSPSHDGTTTTDSKNKDKKKKRVAVIGAGSAGASTAYYLHEFGDSCYDMSIDVFERDYYIGGRSTTVDVYGNASYPAELGASIFVQVNHNLVSAAEKFGLIKESLSMRRDRRRAERSSTGPGDKKGKKEEEEEAGRFGVWDGKDFVFTQPANESYWRTVLRLLWKYGLSPVRTQRLMKATVGAFLRLYEAPYFPFASLSEAALDAGLTPATSQRGSDFLEANGIAPPFSTDLIQASTRVNYAQNLGQIHGLETMVCMATDGAMAVRGGNWRIFESMLMHARAPVHLGVLVTKIAKNSDGTFEVTTEPADGTDDDYISDHQLRRATFDDVVIAAPYQFSGISLPKGLDHVPDKIEYVELHVTLFTSPHRLQPQYFNLTSQGDIPGTVLTTLPDNAVSAEQLQKGQGQGRGRDQGDREPHDFFSISTLDTIFNPATGQNEQLYKIFSPRPVSATLLQRLFLGTALESSVYGKDGQEEDDGVTTWRHDKTWHSYPYLPPRVTFDEPVLDRDGLYYTAGIESFISTMETSSLMGMNVAGLIMERWRQEEDEQQDRGSLHKPERKSGADGDDEL